jgi:hypothetical protein
MSNQEKQLSNPFSTGGGGVNFETRVQAVFVVLMLARGFVPCLPQLPIKKIKLQGKYAGFNTDDLIVFLKEPNGKREVKLLAQIKHSVGITEGNPIFSDVIQAAWNDFQNQEVFTTGIDAFALITGPLSATDINDVRKILEWARASENETDFILKVEQANFSSELKKTKLKVFRSQLKKANNDKEVTDEQLWKFMKSFHLFGYDLDIKTGVTLSLLHSLMGQYSLENIQYLWTRIVDEVQSANQNAGTIEIESLPQDICDLFKERAILVMPESFTSRTDISKVTNWKQIEHARELSIAELIGSWDESFEADKEAIEKVADCTYAEWIDKMRDILLQPGTPLILKNGKWSIPERGRVWDELGVRLFDEYLERFKTIAVNVLKEHDPALELPLDERFAANIYGKVPSHSEVLRRGLAEGLALLSNRHTSLTSLSFNKAESITAISIREILEDADWSLWGSLDRLLPLLAEASPAEFLDAVEKALQNDQCPFDALFAQESSGITGNNYLTGLFWALETLA